jgi:bacteriocin biosynthesis cyclodehydratase domain-containing protein
VQQQIKCSQDIVDLIQDVDLVAFCADRPSNIHMWMNEAALATTTPFITGGYSGVSAEVGPFVIPYQTACLKCFDRNVDDPGKIAELAWIEDVFWLRHPNIHFLTALAANLICSDICKHIIGISQPATYNNRYMLDIEQFVLTPTACSRSAHCISCGQGKPALPSPANLLEKA